MLVAVCHCVRCAACSVRCAAVEYSCSLRHCATERTTVYGISVCGSMRGSVWLPGSACGSVRLLGSARSSVQLSSGVAVCHSPAVCMFSNKFETYLYKFV